ncbi:hypothetical protein ASD86_09260 [Lysobacter sp. Root690]|nr:hypothetical protein ASD86_09260 [Lysobacter sp. Root690]
MLKLCGAIEQARHIRYLAVVLSLFSHVAARVTLLTKRTDQVLQALLEAMWRRRRESGTH